jgi:AcrR family transcriptional regulator
MSTDPSKQVVRRLPKETRVKVIMEAARTVFEEKGYDAALTSEIAQRAGVVEGTIYRYFDSKLDLFIKVVEHWYTEMLSDFDAQLGGIRGTWNRLRFIVWWQLQVVHKDPAMSRMIYEELRYREGFRNTQVFLLQREYTRRTVGTLSAAIASGELQAGIKLSVVRDMIHGCVEHSAFMYMHRQGKFNPDEVADNIAALVYRGLAKATEESDEVRVLERLERVTEKLEALSSRADK